jgi:hypothetical protein
MDFKNITKSLINLSAPRVLKSWIQQLLDKVEMLNEKIISDQTKIDRLEAQIRKLKKLPAKPNFAPKDKTSELGKHDDDENSDKSEKKKETPDERKKRLRKAAAKKGRR